MTMTDAQLVDGCLRGQAHAQRELYRRHAPAIRRVISRCGLEHSDVGDVEQRLWIRLLAPGPGKSALRSFGGRGPLRGWLRQVAVNEARAEHRRRSRVPAIDGLDEVPTSTNEDIDPERATIRNEKRSVVRHAVAAALRSLDPKERELFVLWSQGTTPADLAQLHGVHRTSMTRRLLKLRDRVTCRTREGLWTAYGKSWSELSTTHLEFPRLSGTKRRTSPHR